MDIQNIFRQLNLKEEHVRIYLANLEWGETSITNISRKSKVPRTSIYIYIKDLLSLGLISQTLKQGKKYYLPADPEHIASLLKSKQAEVGNSISELSTKMQELKTIQNTKSGKPKIFYLEGAEGIKQAYEKTFEAKEQFVQCLTSNYEKIVSEEFFREYFEKLFKKTAVKTKEILRADGDESYVSKYGSEKNLQLMVPVVGSAQTDLVIFEETVIFVSYNEENPYALVIEDKDIANSLKITYELAWQQASTLDPRIKRGEKVKTEF